MDPHIRSTGAGETPPRASPPGRPLGGPHSHHQMNRENGNPFFGHTWSIASFPAPVKNSVIPPASSTGSNSLPFQLFAGIWTQNVAISTSVANTSPSHLVAPT